MRNRATRANTSYVARRKGWRIDKGKELWQGIADMNPYYEPILRKYSQINNAAACKTWFEETEPGEEPTHKRTLHPGKGQTVAEVMIHRLLMDVIRNSRLAWQPRKDGGKGRKNPLPDPKDYIQPLADGSPEMINLLAQPIPDIRTWITVPPDEFVITTQDIEEVEEMLKRIQPTKPNHPRIIIGRFTYFWDKAAAGLAVSALTYPLTASITQTMTGTTTKDAKRRRTQLCCYQCTEIILAVKDQIEEIMHYRALQSDNFAERFRRKFTSRKQ